MFPSPKYRYGWFLQMNQEPELDSGRQAHLSAKQKLEQAIQEYLEVCERREDEGVPGGIMTAWYLVTEEQDVVSGNSAHVRVVRDHQAFSATAGLIFYSDEKYRARVRNL